MQSGGVCVQYPTGRGRSDRYPARTATAGRVPVHGPQMSRPGPPPVPAGLIRDAVRAAWPGFDAEFDVRTPHMHLDARGMVVTGLGNLIDATAAPFGLPTGNEQVRSHRMAVSLGWQHGVHGPIAGEAEVRTEWDTVKQRTDLAGAGPERFADLTELRLTDVAIDHLIEVRLDGFADYLSRRPPFFGFAEWPAAAQTALLSMAWALGPAFRLPRFEAYASAMDWRGMAAECRLQPELGSLRRRNDRNQELFAGI